MSIGKSKNIFEKSTDGEIKARIAVLEALLKLSGNQLGMNAGLGNATVDRWTDKHLDISKPLVEKFLSYHKINPEWWQTGKGEVLIKNGTYVDIPKHNDRNGMTVRETFYTDLIENNTEYSLLPRAVFKDYKIVPERILDVIIRSADSEKQALIEKHELIIEGLKNKIKRLESEKEDLQRQIPAKNKS